MTRLRAAAALAVALASSALWTGASAQAAVGPRPAASDGKAATPSARAAAAPEGAFAETLRPHAPAFAELQRKLEGLRRRRMAEYLRLDETQAAELERWFREFRGRQAELRRERERLLAELRHGLEAEDAGRQALERGLEALRRNEEAREGALEGLRSRLREDLTVEQQARLQLFAERFGRQLSEGVRRIRDRRAALRPRPGPDTLRPAEITPPDPPR